MRRVQLTNLINLFHIIRSHLNNLFILFKILHIGSFTLSSTYVVLLNVLLEDLDSYQIKNWNDICWVVLELSIKRFIEFINMRAIYIQCVFFSLSYLFKHGDVMRLLIHVHIFHILPII